ncbi:MAG: hypothetical protein HY613_05180, partial [Candidatus Rokubacteria bacterium]|nr:hypothetical protein [Candidatus Rokubacteria bacterium]
TVWAWGANYFGQLGDGSMTTHRPTPLQVSRPTGLTAIAVGEDHNLALKANGTVWAWGGNGWGQLGDGTTTDRRTPVLVSNLTGVTALAAGSVHSSAVVSPVPPPPPPQVVRPQRLDRCQLSPWLCIDARLEPGVLVLECHLRGCIVIDPIPKNCLVKFKCPSCRPGRLCPPFYHIFFDGLDDVWTVGLFDAKGKPVQHQQFKTPTGIVISFRPSEEQYIETLIGDYFLAFEMGPKGKLAVKYKVKTRLKVSERPYEPK